MSFTADEMHPEPVLHNSAEDLERKCKQMEVGLTDIRNALSTLRTTCATLEMHAERLGSDLLDMKAAICVPAPPPVVQVSRVSQSTMTEIPTIFSNATSQDETQGLPSPPATPRRPHESQDSRPSPRRTERSRNGGHGGSAFIPSTRLTRASKRTFSERGRDGQDMGMVELIFPSARRKPRKRVRFSEIEGLPISDVRTPAEDLLPSSDSDELVLPKPPPVLPPTKKNASGGPSHPVPTEVQNFKMYIRLPKRNERTGLKAQFGEDVSPKNMVNHSRTKTRWDPTSGKRIPLVALPDASQPSLNQGSVAGDGRISEDYEQNLSEGLCNTSLE